jgi:hypothetical protein
MLARLVRARDELIAAGIRPRMYPQVAYAVLRRLKQGERSSLLRRLEYRSQEIGEILHAESEAAKVAKTLSSAKTATPESAYTYLTSVPAELLAFVMAESSNTKAQNKIRQYLQKWRPLRHALTSAQAELEALGMQRGPKFEKVIADLFRMQLAGKGRAPEDRTRLLRKLAGIKEPPKKKVIEEKKRPREKLRGSSAPQPATDKAPTAETVEKAKPVAPVAPRKVASSAVAQAKPGAAHGAQKSSKHASKRR